MSTEFSFVLLLFLYCFVYYCALLCFFVFWYSEFICSLVFASGMRIERAKSVSKSNFTVGHSAQHTRSRSQFPPTTMTWKSQTPSCRFPCFCLLFFFFCFFPLFLWLWFFFVAVVMVTKTWCMYCHFFPLSFSFSFCDCGGRGGSSSAPLPWSPEMMHVLSLSFLEDQWIKSGNRWSCNCCFGDLVFFRYWHWRSSHWRQKRQTTTCSY